jgi:hypothetical protein
VPVAGVGGQDYRERPMARRLRPHADREAILALGLAGLGFVSMEATLPAAGVLGVRAIRRRDDVSGCDPAMGVLVLGVSWLSFLLGYPTLRALALTAAHAQDPWRIAAFVVGWAALALAAFWLANFLIGAHPERWLARRAARAGIVAVVLAGLLQTFAVTAGASVVGESCGSSMADCLGTTPWASVVPAAAIGLAWLAVSLTLAPLTAAWRRRARSPAPPGG